MFDEDVVDHIAKVLKILDLIEISYVDSHQLRMKVFPLSLADDARQWWINEGDGKITTWEELVEIFFCKFYLESRDGKDEMLDEGDTWGIDPLEFISRVNLNHIRVDGRTKKEYDYGNPPDTTTDSFFKPYSKTLEKNDVEKEDEQRQAKRKDNKNDFEINNKEPNKRVCKAKKFKAIKYSLGPNEEYIALKKCEYNAWEKNEDSVSQIYQENFQKKDNGWMVTRTE
ncbi:hypothetical protein Tco_1391187 [Tanacetum coccineum]